MSKALYKSGFCGIGLHEGTSPVGLSGTPLKVCVFWLECNCPCHAEISEIFKLTGMERMPQQNPKWKPERSPYVMPSVEDRVASRIASGASNGSGAVGGPSAPVTIERDATGILPPVYVRSFGATDTGRAARGELETWVRRATDFWVVESKLDETFRVVCSPPWISKQIAEAEGIKEPSTGAVTSVLERWLRLGFAKLERKPLRFTGYTEEGIKVGLEALKLRTTKKETASARLGNVKTKRR